MGQWTARSDSRHLFIVGTWLGGIIGRRSQRTGPGEDWISTSDAKSADEEGWRRQFGGVEPATSDTRYRRQLAAGYRFRVSTSSSSRYSPMTTCTQSRQARAPQARITKNARKTQSAYVSDVGFGVYVDKTTEKRQRRVFSCICLSSCQGVITPTCVRGSVKHL